MFKNIIDHPMHAAFGAVVGQILLPVPVLGAYLGAEIGGHIGAREEAHDLHVEAIRAHIEAEAKK